jgi:hypothetical protein
LELLLFILSWEEWSSFIEFCDYAAETPNIDGEGVFESEDNLWSSVEPTLNISVDLVVIEAAGAEIN